MTTTVRTGAGLAVGIAVAIGLHFVVRGNFNMSDLYERIQNNVHCMGKVAGVDGSGFFRLLASRCSLQKYQSEVSIPEHTATCKSLTVVQVVRSTVPSTGSGPRGISGTWKMGKNSSCARTSSDYYLTLQRTVHLDGFRLELELFYPVS